LIELAPIADLPQRSYRQLSMAGHVSNRVAQATGMISAQAGCDIDEALQLLIVRAEALGQSIEETALDVLDGVIRFDP
jgi:hypothetical protein